MRTSSSIRVLPLLGLVAVLLSSQARSADPSADKHTTYFEPNSVVALSVGPASGTGASTGVTLSGAMGFMSPVGEASGPGSSCLPGFYASFIGFSEVVDVPDGTALRTYLKQNHPNPFNPVTSISFSLSRTTLVRLEIYDLRGKRIRTLLSEERDAGIHDVVWDGRNGMGEIQSSGAYLFRLQAGDYTETKKLTVIK